MKSCLFFMSLALFIVPVFVTADDTTSPSKARQEGSVQAAPRFMYCGYGKGVYSHLSEREAESDIKQKILAHCRKTYPHQESPRDYSCSLQVKNKFLCVTNFFALGEKDEDNNQMFGLGLSMTAPDLKQMQQVYQTAVYKTSGHLINCFSSSGNQEQDVARFQNIGEEFLRVCTETLQRICKKSTYSIHDRIRCVYHHRKRFSELSCTNFFHN